MTPTTNEQFSPGGPSSGSGSNGGGLTEAARDQAGHLKDTTLEASQQVTGTAKEKAGEVAADVRQQTRQLVGETRSQVGEQAGQQRDRAVQGLRSVGEELRGMAEHGQSGWGTQLARHGADLTDQAADFIQDRGANDILDDVRRVARRNPGRFLLIAAAAGVVAGRLSRAIAAGDPADDTTSGQNGTTYGRTETAYDTTPVGTTYAATDAGTSYGTDAGYATTTDAGTYPTTDGGGDYGGTAGTATGDPVTGRTGLPGEYPPPADDDLLVQPPAPTPVAPDPDPGAPVQPTFGPGTGR